MSQRSRRLRTLVAGVIAVVATAAVLMAMTNAFAKPTPPPPPGVTETATLKVQQQGTTGKDYSNQCDHGPGWIFVLPASQGVAFVSLTATFKNAGTKQATIDPNPKFAEVNVSPSDTLLNATAVITGGAADGSSWFNVTHVCDQGFTTTTTGKPTTTTTTKPTTTTTSTTTTSTTTTSTTTTTTSIPPTTTTSTSTTAPTTTTSTTTPLQGPTTTTTIPQGTTQAFLCYETQQRVPTVGSLGVADQFGTNMLQVGQLHHLCAPADVNGANPGAPADPNHLTAYNASAQSNPASGDVVTATNSAFGSVNLALEQVVATYTPASKSLAAPPPAPLTPPTPDNFTCYNVNAQNFQEIDGVQVQDQFENITVNLVDVQQFCAPTNYNTTTLNMNPSHLVCYQLKMTNFQMPTDVFITDTFQSGQIFPDGHVVMLCVASTKQIISTAGRLTSAASALPSVPSAPESAPAAAWWAVGMAAIVTTAAGIRRRLRRRRGAVAGDLL
jgi:hypothetical protein